MRGRSKLGCLIVATALAWGQLRCGGRAQGDAAIDGRDAAAPDAALDPCDAAAAPDCDGGTPDPITGLRTGCPSVMVNRRGTPVPLCIHIK